MYFWRVVPASSPLLFRGSIRATHVVPRMWISRTGRTVCASAAHRRFLSNQCANARIQSSFGICLFYIEFLIVYGTTNGHVDNSPPPTIVGPNVPAKPVYGALITSGCDSCPLRFSDPATGPDHRRGVVTLVSRIFDNLQLSVCNKLSLGML